MRAKYVMTAKGPIIFPESFQHKEFEIFHPLSAGQLSIDGELITVFGDSVSLELKPDKFDAELITSAFGIKKGD